MITRLLLLLVLGIGININTLNAQCAAGEIEVHFILLADNYPGEISWEITGPGGNILITGDIPNINGYQLDTTYCIPDLGCTAFTMIDAYGDGICCGYGQGNYEVYIDGQFLVSGGNYGTGETTNFNCPPGSGCSSPDTVQVGSWVAPNADYWYVFQVDSTGLYEFSTCSANNSCDTKIWIYDHCQGLIYDETNIGTIAYADTGCGVDLAYLTVALAAGSSYYIRIGDDMGACGNSSIDWEVNYLGPIVGCMDIMSCNYNPLATIPDTSCVYPGDPDCDTGPDLMVVEPTLWQSMYIDYIPNNDACLIQEGCVHGYGQRELIRFTTHIKNIGTMDYHIGYTPPTPNSPSNQWEWDYCHNHWHYEGYAEYVLYDAATLAMIPIGFKNGFCVMDLECSGGGTAQYGCGMQGISHGCGDIYGAGLSCQWIDITNLAVGDYIFVCRVNWDYTPDALGRYEMDYSNNWGQVCFHLDRDSITGNASFTIEQNCTPFYDCAGVLYGNAQPDCGGTCNGYLLAGDLDSDTSRTMDDEMLYLAEALGDTLSAIACNDLNADGRINVVDAALLQECVLHATDTMYWGSEFACTFPTGLYNPNQIAILNAGRINTDSNYVEIDLLNPFNKLMAFEFEISGVAIQSVESLIPGFNPVLQFDAQGEIVGIGTDESFIDKNFVPTPMLRVYYSALTDSGEVCITHIEAMVNEIYEETEHQIGIQCISTLLLDQAAVTPTVPTMAVFPNPFDESARVVFTNTENLSYNFEMMDVQGKVVRSETNIRGNEFLLERNGLPSGLYLLRLFNGNENHFLRVILK